MTALTGNISRDYRAGEVIDGVGLQASVTVHQGSLLEIDANGRVKPAAKAASKTYFGVAETAAANGATAGAETVRVRRKGTFLFAKTGTAVVGKAAYVVDDNTVTDVSTSATACGTIIDTDTAGVWVELDL